MDFRNLGNNFRWPFMQCFSKKGGLEFSHLRPSKDMFPHLNLETSWISEHYLTAPFASGVGGMT